MALSNRDRVGRGFEFLAEGLAPFVEHHIRGIAPGDVEWITWLGRRLYSGNSKMKISGTDPLVLLRAITQEDDAFKGVLSRSERSYAQELWECRNNWAHNVTFNEGDTNRLLDTMERLLRATGAGFEADEVRKLLETGKSAGGADTQASSLDARIRRTGSAGSTEAIAVATIAIWVALLSLMLGILPDAALSEKVLIICASLALAIGVVSGYRALHNVVKFTVMAVSVFSALILLASLSIVASSQAQTQRAKDNASASNAATYGPDQHPSSTPSVTQPSQSVQPEPSVPATSSISTTTRSARPLYLSGLTGSTARYDASPPENGSWAISGVDYPHSLGYPDLSSQEFVTFQFNSSYQYFEATVGVADGADPSDQNTAVDFEVDTGSGSQLGSADAQYGHPALIKIKVTGISSVTLYTDPSEFGFNYGDNDSIAVWGNAELIQ